MERPYFFWDYQISDEQVLALLRQGTVAEKAWVISRILQYAKWEDIWRYLTLADIQENFEHIRFRHPEDRALWAYALERWSQHGS